MQKHERWRPHGCKARRVALRRAPGGKRRAGPTGGRAKSRAGPIDDDDRHEVGDRAPMAPAMELPEVVRAHDPDEMDGRRVALDPCERLLGVARADAGLDIRYDDARAGDETPRRLDALLQRRQLVLRFERIARRH